MLDAGLERIAHWESEIRDCASLPISLNLEGYKPLGLALKCAETAAVVSVPRYGPTTHNRITAHGLAQAGVLYWFGQGAYWHQTISEMMEARIADGARYVLTLDYDTVATYEEIIRVLDIKKKDILTLLGFKRVNDCVGQFKCVQNSPQTLTP